MDNSGEKPLDVTQAEKVVATKAAAKKSPVRKKSKVQKKAAKPRRTRIAKPYPTSQMEEVVVLAKTLFAQGSGLPVRRLTVFDAMGRAPDSGAGRELVTASAKYGLTKGAYNAEILELTPLGKSVVDPQSKPREKARAKISCAISNIDIFKAVYENLISKKFPSRAFLLDAFRDLEVPEKHLEEAVDTFSLNLKYVNLLQNLAGAERVVAIDAVLDDLPAANEARPITAIAPQYIKSVDVIENDIAQKVLGKSCFIVTPIGSEGSEERKHADLIMGSYIEPVVEEFGLTAVRADKIHQTGMITRQIFDYLINAELVIADLSFSNPNVFYELAIRHAMRKPVIQIIRTGDKLPFDINQIRTIHIDLSDVYAAIPQVNIVQTELRNQIRKALDNPDQVESPISVFYPNLSVPEVE